MFTMTSEGMVYTCPNGEEIVWDQPTFYLDVNEMIRALVPPVHLDKHKAWSLAHNNMSVANWHDSIIMDDIPMEAVPPFIGAYAGKRACYFFHDTFGIWPKHFMKWHVKETMQLFGLAPYSRLLFSARGLNSNKAQRIYRNMSAISQASKDGVEHIIPLIMLTERSPHDMKCMLGKALWKKLSHNSMSRNMLLFNALDCQYFISDLSTPYARAHVAKLQALPSTLLKLANNASPDRLHAAKTIYPKYKTAAKCLYSTAVIEYTDTIDMAEQLGVSFKPLPYSRARIKRKHDEFARRLRANEYSDEKWHEGVSYTVNEWLATEIVSPLGLALEADAMHHCVNTYVHQCRSGSYRVFSLTKNDERIATVGVRVQRLSMSRQMLTLDQILGHCNREIVTPGFKLDEFLAYLSNCDKRLNYELP